MKTAEETAAEYKSIEVDNRTIIMNEEQAFRLLYNMQQAFNWVGAMLCPDDVRETIIHRRNADDKAPYSPEELEERVNRVLDTRDWRKGMGEWMSSEGYTAIGEIVWEEIESHESR